MNLFDVNERQSGCRFNLLLFSCRRSCDWLLDARINICTTLYRLSNSSPSIHPRIHEFLIRLHCSHYVHYADADTDRNKIEATTSVMFH